jgi:hypothetical protein
LLASGCASEERPEESGRREAGTPVNVVACRRDFAAGFDARMVTDAGRVSFQRDLMPLFVRRCNFGGCHEGRGPSGQMHLGDACTFDVQSSICGVDAGSITPEVAALIHQNLLSPSNAAPNLKRVEPGRIETSFLLLKLSGCQDAFFEITGCKRCGNSMPPNTTLREDAPEEFDEILRWVQEGAALE